VPDDFSFNSNRLTIARRRRGLSKTKLAELIGVDLRSVTAYELGEYPPAQDTLARLSAVLGFPTEFFSGDDLDELSTETASFRAMKKMSASKRDMALGQGAIALHFNRWLDSKFELPSPNLPDLSHEANPEVAAESLRRAWGIGELSVRNMIHLVEAKGVRVFSLAIDTREVDAFSVWKDGVPFIFLNTYKSAEHSRFDVAHELGHLVLHKHGGPRRRDAEKEAHLFASAFLMPRGSVIANVPKFATYPVLVELKKVWLTSVSALVYRLHALRLLTDWQYRGLSIEIANRGKDIEPNEAPREISLLLPKMLQSLYEDGINRSQIARELAISTSELEKLIFGLAIAGIKGGGNGGSTRQVSTPLRRVK
jgi:Zn-dependent peptidase ImmA (M78 family)/DNA-binding XRE family transcriptional regulator